jgi:uncharacterized protein
MNRKMPKPLSEKELDQLSSILSSFPHEKAMTLEEVDGFFAAFHCCPEITPFSEILPDIWGDETGEEDAPFKSTEEFNQFLDLLLRYWNHVGQRFQEEVFFPTLLQDNETEEVKGNEWAQGFLRGTYIAGGFQELMEDENEGGCFIPIFVLAYEHDANPELRPFKESIPPEERETLLALLCAGVTRIYHYFSSHRKAYAQKDKEKNTIRNSANKIGRNDPCYCGSGIKYKKCCWHVTLH